MKDARDAVHNRISQVKSFLAQEQPPRLSESDTKANFIEPIIAALGWEGIGVVTREYYVRNSQEFIDYVMRGPEGLLLAIEAKPLRTDLTDKHAAQLIQYCAVEGIEWAALMNGRELQFFNTFLKPDLAAKRVLQLDLLAFNTDEEFDVLFGQIWQLSRASMTEPKGVRTWLNQRRLDAALRTVLLDPSSTTIRYLRRILNDQEVSANSQELTQWFRSHLAPPITVLPSIRPLTEGQPKLRPGGDQGGDSSTDQVDGQNDQRFLDEISDVSGAKALTTTLCMAFRDAVDHEIADVSWRATKQYVAAAMDGSTFLAVRFRADRIVVGLALDAARESTRFTDNHRQFNWARITKVIDIRTRNEIDVDLLSLAKEARAYATREVRKTVETGPERTVTFYGVSLRDLVDAGLLDAGTQLILVGSENKEITRAILTPKGEIQWHGSVYGALSDRVFIQLLGRKSMNGWVHWYADHPQGRESLFSIREQYRNLMSGESISIERIG